MVRVAEKARLVRWGRVFPPSWQAQARRRPLSGSQEMWKLSTYLALSRQQEVCNSCRAATNGSNFIISMFCFFHFLGMTKWLNPETRILGCTVRLYPVVCTAVLGNRMEGRGSAGDRKMSLI